MKEFVEKTLIKINEMKKADVRDIFEQIKEKKLKSWKNITLEKTYIQLTQSSESLLFENAYEPNQMREILETYTYEKFKN